MFYQNRDWKMYYEVYGKGENTLIILPGWGDNRKTFMPLINALENDLTIYSIDFPGFGNSSVPMAEKTIYDYAILINDFIKDQNINKPIILGHSFGGRIAILLAGYYHLELDKLILIDSAGIKPHKTIKQKIRQCLYKLKKKLASILPHHKRSLYLKKLLQKYGSKDYQALPVNMQRTFQNIVNEDLTYYLKDIKIPTILLWGDQDIDTPLSDGKTMELEIPDSALIILEGCHHFSYLERQEETKRIIQAFLDIKE